MNYKSLTYFAVVATLFAAQAARAAHEGPDPRPERLTYEYLLHDYEEGHAHARGDQEPERFTYEYLLKKYKDKHPAAADRRGVATASLRIDSLKAKKAASLLWELNRVLGEVHKLSDQDGIPELLSGKLRGLEYQIASVAPPRDCDDACVISVSDNAIRLLNNFVGAAENADAPAPILTGLSQLSSSLQAEKNELQ